MIFSKLFKKKKPVKTYILFGRRVLSGHVSKCDCCGDVVSWSDYVYLCRGCRDKLPMDLKESHHRLVPYQEIRKKILTEAILKKKHDETYLGMEDEN